MNIEDSWDYSGKYSISSMIIQSLVVNWWVVISGLEVEKGCLVILHNRSGKKLIPELGIHY